MPNLLILSLVRLKIFRLRRWDRMRDRRCRLYNRWSRDPGYLLGKWTGNGGDENGDTLAIIRPIPLVPPVTSATRPLTEKRELMFVEAIMETLEGRPVSALGFEL